MSQRITRREALTRAAVAAGTVAVASLPSAAPAIEPIARNGKAKFKFSLAAYSYRDLLTSKSGSPALTLDDFIADCAKMQLDATELTSYYFPDPVTDEYLHHIKSLTFRLGLDISGTSTRNDFCVPKGADRDKELAYCKRWVDYADTMVAGDSRLLGQATQGSGPGRGPQAGRRRARRVLRVRWAARRVPSA